MDKDKQLILILSTLAIALLLTASLSGILLDDSGNPYQFISLRGENVEIYGGQGLYQYDNTYKAVAFRSFDWVNLIVVLPLFILGVYFYQQGRLKGQLLLAAIFTYLAYIYLIGVMGNAFNIMFLVWTALFSLGIFGVFLIVTKIDIASLPDKLKTNFPRKSLSVYVVLLGLVLFFQYLSEILLAYVTGQPSVSLDHYTTLELASFELGIMVPLHIIGGVLLLKRKAWGYLLAILLVFATFMTFIALSVSLLLSYFLFGQGSVADMVITITIAVIATGFSLVTFQRVKD